MKASARLPQVYQFGPVAHLHLHDENSTLLDVEGGLPSLSQQVLARTQSRHDMSPKLLIFVALLCSLHAVHVRRQPIAAHVAGRHVGHLHPVALGLGLAASTALVLTRYNAEAVAKRACPWQVVRRSFGGLGGNALSRDAKCVVHVGRKRGRSREVIGGTAIVSQRCRWGVQAELSTAGGR